MYVEFEVHDGKFYQKLPLEFICSFFLFVFQVEDNGLVYLYFSKASYEWIQIAVIYEELSVYIMAFTSFPLVPVFLMDNF